MEHSWSLAAEQVTAEPTKDNPDEDVFSDDFDAGLGTSFAQSSDGECYSRLMCKIFLKECLVELLVDHLTSNCCPPAANNSPAKTLPKLAKLVVQMLSKLAGNLVSRLPADSKQRVEISERYGVALTTLLVERERGDFACSADFADTVSSFLPLLSQTVLVHLMTVLLRSPEDCVEQSEDGSGMLSPRGQLMISVLQCVLNHLPSTQPEILTGVSVGLCKILKLVPSDDVICDSVTAVAQWTPLLAANLTQSVASSLLKASTRSSLSLMRSAAEDSEKCKQLMVDWFAGHRSWSREQNLPIYLDTVLFVLKACRKGLILTCFLIMAPAPNRRGHYSMLLSDVCLSV